MGTNFTASDEILVNTETTGAQYTPAMTTLDDGGWVIVWTSIDQDGNGGGVYLQRYAADGTAVGTETRVNTETSASQYARDVAILDDGGWIVTWTSQNQDGSRSGVYQQRYDADGDTVGVETQVNTTTIDNQTNPSVTGLADGGWIVAFAMTSEYGSSRGLFQQRYDADGDPVGGETMLVDYADGAVTSPVVSHLDDGGWIAAWNLLQQPGNQWFIRAQRFDADGDAVGDIVQIDPPWGESYSGQAITTLADGGWVVTWSIEKNYDGVAIAQQRFDANGNAVGGVTEVGTGENTVSPSVTALADGGWVVTWTEWDDDTKYDIFAQRFDANGTEVGGKMAVNTTTADWQTSPDVTALPDGGFVISWASDEQDGDANGVYQRTFGAPIIGDDNGNALTGGEGDDPIKGGDGNDTLNGGAGADTMTGGAGNDVFIVDDSGDRAFGGSGTDQVFASASFSLSDGTENLTLTGVGNINGTGNGAANKIIGNGGNNRLNGNGGNDLLVGNSGNDTLNGGSGRDTMAGGQGNDVYVVDNSGDRVFGGGGHDRVIAAVSFNLSGDTEDLRLTGSGNINGTGNGGANTITGNGGSNRLNGNGGNDLLVGNSGNDTLNGGSGRDTMAGGQGNDVYVVDNSGDRVFGGGGHDRVIASVSFNLSGDTEDLRLTGSGNINGAGNGGANVIAGNGGANVIAGNGGSDLLFGGGGSDKLFGGSGADTLRGNGGNDFLSGGGQNDAMIGGGGSDFLKGNGGKDYLSGGGQNDKLAGGSGNDVLQGGSGSDKLFGGGQNDRLFGGNHNDLLNGGAGADSLNGQGGKDYLSGGGQNDVLFGGGGSDRLSGGSGNDRINGGGGDDTAIFKGGIGRYEVTEIGGGRIKVVDTKGAFGTDILSNVEKLQFGSKVFKAGKAVELAEQTNALAQADDANHDLGLNVHHLLHHDDFLI
ncbi:Ca2+-binding RTX toxin-like protein [Rhodobium orientis]|uniref:Calcium-binding protein n=1 Tax=Rhodobium orientis TaxID=34017 RepID=A0A327JGE5_9HYPH|nr:calcium-binding protein [Rhodobium orientis]MBB4301632.1 Ca2+-binding RTX toxin-like protein [Rhodobium orientis]MBK5952329.1 hypothetical protein [Rhodobium orientis]RAI25399.1 hypothetical protein CH339_18280 [Rhodobium orientis]